MWVWVWVWNPKNPISGGALEFLKIPLFVALLYLFIYLSFKKLNKTESAWCKSPSQITNKRRKNATNQLKFAALSRIWQRKTFCTNNSNTRQHIHKNTACWWIKEQQSFVRRLQAGGGAHGYSCCDEKLEVLVKNGWASALTADIRLDGVKAKNCCGGGEKKITWRNWHGEKYTFSKPLSQFIPQQPIFYWQGNSKSEKRRSAHRQQVVLVGVQVVQQFGSRAFQSPLDAVWDGTVRRPVFLAGQTDHPDKGQHNRVRKINLMSSFRVLKL